MGGRLASGGGEGAAVFQQVAKRALQRFGLGGGERHPASGAVHVRRVARVIREQHGQAARHCLLRCNGEALAARGQQEHVGSAVELGHALGSLRAQHAHAIAGGPVGEAPGAGHHQLHTGARGGSQRQVHALLRHEPAHEQRARALVPAETLPQRLAFAGPRRAVAPPIDAVPDLRHGAAGRQPAQLGLDLVVQRHEALGQARA